MLETGNSLLFDGDYSGAPAAAPYYPSAAPGQYGGQQGYMGGGQTRYGGGAYEQPSYY